MFNFLTKKKDGVVRALDISSDQVVTMVKFENGQVRVAMWGIVEGVDGFAWDVRGRAA